MIGTVTIVDVGQGDCTVAVDATSKLALVIDCNAGRHRSAIDELEALGFSELTAAIVTHSHRDHFGGVLDLLEELAERFTGTLYLNIDTLVAMPPGPGEELKQNKTIVRALLNRAREYAGRVAKADSDVPIQTLGGISWQLLAPTYDQLLEAVASGNPNIASGIVLIRSPGGDVVVGGDAPLESWQGVEGHLPSQSVVRWPHHGGHLSPADDAQDVLMALLKPSVVLVSVGAQNAHGHPSGGFFDAVSAHGSRLLCTEATASCAGGDGGGVCAGSVRVHLANNAEPLIEPATADHQTVIEGWGTARCLD